MTASYSSFHSWVLATNALTTQIQALDALGQEALLDDGLGGDAGVVGAGHPQRRIAPHPVEPDQHVLQRVVERMPQMQGSGDVGWRDEDGVAIALGLDRQVDPEDPGRRPALPAPPARHRRAHRPWATRWNFGAQQDRKTSPGILPRGSTSGPARLLVSRRDRGVWWAPWSSVRWVRRRAVSAGAQRRRVAGTARCAARGIRWGRPPREAGAPT